MSPFTLIKLFLGSAFKGRGFEEEEHLCAENESRAGWVGLEMVLPGASILKKDKRLTFSWWQHRFGCLEQSVLSLLTGASLNSENHPLKPTREPVTRSNLFSVVLLSCSLSSKRAKTGERGKSPSGKTTQGNLWNGGSV